MFGYNPYGAYSSPYTTGHVRGYPSYSGSYSPDSEYLRALADERAAREQYLAARRAQEEARERAARARLARNAYAPYTTYNSYLDDDFEDHDAYDGGLFSAGYPFGSGYGYAPRQRRALAEEQRRREQLERERELGRIEEERKRLEQERRRMEEERMRKLLAEEQQRRREEDELRRRRAAQFDPFLHTYGLSPEGDDMNAHTRRPSLRSQTVAPSHRRQMSPRSANPYTSHANTSPHASSASRSSSVPPRGAAPPSPISPQPHLSASPRTTIPIRTPSPKVKPSSPVPKAPTPPPQPKVEATPQQHAAARKIQEAYRAHAARAQALTKIAELRGRFVELRSSFHFPASLDFLLPDGMHAAVPVDTALVVQIRPDSQEDAREDAETQKRPSLAYTPTNAPLHGYLEELNRLLSALDAVESHGDAGIREARKALVREVEGEAERVERIVVEVWTTWHSRDDAEGHQAECAEALDQSAAAAPSTNFAVEEAISAPPATEGTTMEVESPDVHGTSDQGTQPESEPTVITAETTESNPVESSATLNPTSATPNSIPVSESRDAEDMEVEPETERTASDSHPGELETPASLTDVQTQPHELDPDPEQDEITIEVVEAEPEQDEDDYIEVDVPQADDGEGIHVEPPETHPSDGSPATQPEMVPPPEDAPTPEVEIEDADADADVPASEDVVKDESRDVPSTLPAIVVEEAPPTPEIDIPDEPAEMDADTVPSSPVAEGLHPDPIAVAPAPDIEPPDEGHQDHAVQPDPDVKGPSRAQGVPEPVPSDSLESQSSSAALASTAPDSPVHLHPAISGFVEPTQDQSRTSSEPPLTSKADQKRPLRASLEEGESADIAHIERRPSPLARVEEPRGVDAEEQSLNSQHKRTTMPTLSPSHFDGESEGEGEGPGTPPSDMHRLLMPSPVIIVTPADDQQQAVMGDTYPAAEQTMGRMPDEREEQKADRPRFPLINREWRDVESYDMF